MRVYLEDCECGRLVLGEGDYGKDHHGVWHVRPPGQHTGILADHEITEHEDGTITVNPSILLEDAEGKVLWHGHLVRGEWNVLEEGG